MKTTIIVALTLVLMSSVAGADTRTGSAKGTSLIVWSFLATGETKIVLSWSKSASALLSLVICGTDPGDTDPLTFGAAAGDLNRFSEITMSAPSGSYCLVGVGKTSGPNSAFRMHVNQVTSEITTSEGRVFSTENTTPLELHAQNEFRRLLALSNSR